MAVTTKKKANQTIPPIPRHLVHAVHKVTKDLTREDIRQMFPEKTIRMKYGDYARWVIYTKYGKAAKEDMIADIQKKLKINRRFLAEMLFDIMLKEVIERLSQIVAAQTHGVKQ